MLVGNRREQEPIQKSHSACGQAQGRSRNWSLLRQRQEERQLAQAVTDASEDAFAKVWDNPADAPYDRL